jgi:HSP20 family protein
MANTALEKRRNDENQQNIVNVPERMEQQQYFTPLVDIIETNDAFTFYADLPGVKPGDVDISFENGALTISGKVQPRRPENANYLWREYGVGHFYRSFTLGTPVNVDGIKAELKNGELTLTVPKHESARTRKIEIKTS